MKTLIVGIIVGFLMAFVIAAMTPENIAYQANLCDVKDTCIYAILNTRTGETHVFQISPGQGHVVIQQATLDLGGYGDWKQRRH